MLRQNSAGRMNSTTKKFSKHVSYNIVMENFQKCSFGYNA